MRNNVYGLDSDCVLRVVFYLKHIVLFDSIYAVLTIDSQQDRHVHCVRCICTCARDYFRFLPFFLEDFEGDGVSWLSPSLDATLSAFVLLARGGMRLFGGLT